MIFNSLSFALRISLFDPISKISFADCCDFPHFCAVSQWLHVAIGESVTGIVLLQLIQVYTVSSTLIPDMVTDDSISSLSSSEDVNTSIGSSIFSISTIEGADRWRFPWYVLICNRLS